MTKAVLFLLFTFLCFSTITCGLDDGYEFEVDFEIKIQERNDSAHPHYNLDSNGETKKFWINHLEMPILLVTRGKTYTFRYNSEIAFVHPFYLFKDSSSAGLGCIDCGQALNTGYYTGFFPRSEELTANGQLLYWTVPHDAPDFLWYGSGNSGYMGWKVRVSGDGTPNNNLFVKKPKYFVVQDVPKIAHPWNTAADKALCDGKGFAINGFEGQSLILERGEEYTFLFLNSKENAFVFPTFDSLGGVGKESDYGTNYAENGEPKEWKYMVPKDGPDYSYYQSLNNKRAGGHVSFIDKKIVDYHVWVDIKTSEHPHYGTGELRGYQVNGKEGATLTLKRGKTYVFYLEQDPRFPFRITDVEGGATFLGPVEHDGVGLPTGDLGWGDPARHLKSVEYYQAKPTSQNYMLLTFTPTKSTPDTLYYESGLSTWMGGKIIIIDDPCDGKGGKGNGKGHGKGNGKDQDKDNDRPGHGHGGKHDWDHDDDDHNGGKHDWEHDDDHKGGKHGPGKNKGNRPGYGDKEHGCDKYDNRGGKSKQCDDLFIEIELDDRHDGRGKGKYKGNKGNTKDKDNKDRERYRSDEL